MTEQNRLSLSALLAVLQTKAAALTARIDEMAQVVGTVRAAVQPSAIHPTVVQATRQYTKRAKRIPVTHYDKKFRQALDILRKRRVTQITSADILTLMNIGETRKTAVHHRLATPEQFGLSQIPNTRPRVFQFISENDNS